MGILWTTPSRPGTDGGGRSVPRARREPSPRGVARCTIAAPKACSQRTITVGDDATRKLRQETYWLSDDWIASYSRRTRVEGGFGILKKTANGGIKRGWTRQVTRVRTAFLLALAVAASNLDQLISWALASGDDRDPLTSMDVTDHGFEEYEQHGDLPANPPPGVAP